MELGPVAHSTNNSTFKKLATLALITLMAVGLSSCGRRGALQAPASAQIDNGNVSSEKPATKSPKPDKKFILDGLI